MENKAARRPLDATAFGIMLVLCLCWGFQQVAMKLAAPDISTVMQIALRSGFAAVVIGAYLLWKSGLSQFRDGSIGPGLIAGLLFTMEFLFIAWAINFTYASHVSVFVYTSPIWSALGLHLLLPEERMSRAQWLGVVVAFIGIGVAFFGRGDTPGAGASNMLLGDFLALLGGMSWGLTTVVIRTTRISEAPAARTLFYQVAVATILMLLVAAVTGATHMEFTQTAVVSLGFQSVIVTLVTFLVWFWMLKRYLASRLGILSFMTPLFGVVSAVIVLHEPVDANFAIGALLVLAGILIVNSSELVRRRVAAKV